VLATDWVGDRLVRRMPVERREGSELVVLHRPCMVVPAREVHRELRRVLARTGPENSLFEKPDGTLQAHAPLDELAHRGVCRGRGRRPHGPSGRARPGRVNSDTIWEIVNASISPSMLESMPSCSMRTVKGTDRNGPPPDWQDFS
jgi:hypothetical protein